MSAPAYQKLKTHWIWSTIFFRGQNHEQEKIKITNNKKISDLGAYLRPERTQYVLQGPEKHERTHPRAEWVTKGKILTDKVATRVT